MPGTPVKQMDFPGGGRFLVVVYDLLSEPVDRIVNAANGGLSHSAPLRLFPGERKRLEISVFPGISSGAFLVPLDICARAYLQAVKEYHRPSRGKEAALRTIRLCLLKGPLLEG